LGILTRRDIIAAYNKALIKKSLFNKWRWCRITSIFPCKIRRALSTN